ncbi:TM2 domain-containing protein 3 [Strongylocentrotus purpuratus]|uniref:TM2 domain-containing protein n=1 Tax=Strongylocentrotus purpuratus TaxID=7668 RepID=A0A7M7N825_STRPU|nr:TM2 domain-containing protein 3 [Strongylocentrotus purpuratus]|eukprot:XP_011677226.1 PREDICTED: TM2 domain-containing protein 3-like [Strongylocentrotus purpuratus]
MDCKSLCIVILIILPFCIHCQDGTSLGTGGQDPATPAQTMAAVVQENVTKTTTTPKPDTNRTSSPATQAPGSANASTSTSGPTKNETSPVTTLANGEPDEELPTEDTVTDDPTATVGLDDDSITTTAQPTKPSVPAYYELCPSGLPCEMLGAQCLNCSMDTSCVYGREYNTTCYPNQGLDCVGSLPVERSYQCRYCYQTETWQQSCTPANNCHVYACPKQYIKVNCTVDEDVFCLGSRNFHRRKPCNWTSGSKWSTALILSITLGGFGADRFYLGYWQSGLGKLFSFGGAGVWTLIDVLLIAVGYITPSDGSHYIY